MAKYIWHIARPTDSSLHQGSPLSNMPQKAQWVWQYGQRKEFGTKKKFKSAPWGKWRRQRFTTINSQNLCWIWCPEFRFMLRKTGKNLVQLFMRFSEQKTTLSASHQSKMEIPSVNIPLTLIHTCTQHAPPAFPSTLCIFLRSWCVNIWILVMPWLWAWLQK